MIYFIILFLLLFFTLIYDFFKVKSGKKIVYYIVLIGLICLSGFRYRVGGDTLMYMIVHPRLPSLSELGSNYAINEKLQPLWIFFVAVSKSITEEFYMIQLLHGIIINTLIFNFIKSNTKYIFTAILLYYIGYYGYFNFEILRESIAVAIFLYSIKFIKNKKWVAYYIISLLALSVHFSAIVLFVIPLLLKLKFNLSRALIIFILGVIFGVFFIKILFSLNIGGGLVESIKLYLDYKPTFYGLISILVLYILYPWVIYKISNYYLKIESNLNNFLNVYILIGASTSFFFIFFRFLNYLTPILFLFIAEIIHGVYRKGKFKQVGLTSGILTFIVFSVIHMNAYFSDTSQFVESSRWYSRWYPYYSIFDKEIDETREKLVIEQNKFQLKKK